MVSYERLKVSFFLKSLIHINAYYQPVPNMIFLFNSIEIRKKTFRLTQGHRHWG